MISEFLAIEYNTFTFLTTFGKIRTSQGTIIGNVE